MKTIVYIDGFNLYYGCLKNSDLKWLDLGKYFRCLMPDCNIVAVKYFTADVHRQPYDLSVGERQKAYFSAIKETGSAQIIKGEFKVRKKEWSPINANAEYNISYKKKGEKDRKCAKLFMDAEWQPMAKVLKQEEKQTDVNIAVEMMWDACQENMEHAVLVSGDSDLLAPVEKLIEMGIKVTVKHTSRRKNHRRSSPKSPLFKAASEFSELDVKLMAECQFPDTISVANSKDNISKPCEW